MRISARYGHAAMTMELAMATLVAALALWRSASMLISPRFHRYGKWLVV
jgi:hypothetical protein